MVLLPKVQRVSIYEFQEFISEYNMQKCLSVYSQ